jgi:hypothetical protein
VPFRHPDRSHNLDTRIAFEVRERLEEAVDHVCLEALVRVRRERGLPPPAADNTADRRAYNDNVLAFLELLGRDLGAELSPEERRTLDDGSQAGDRQARLVALQVTLARRLPDYWQRFDTLRTQYLAEPDSQSGRESRGLLGRFFRRR